MTLVRDDLRALEGFPLGVDNVSKVTPEAALRSADNIDLSDEGKPRRREGYQLALAGNFHSLFGHEHVPFLLARRGGDLVLVEGEGPSLSVTGTVATGLGTAPASYEVLNGEVLWSVEGVATGVINAWTEVRPMGSPTPARVACASVTGGALAAGRYLVAIAYLLDSGEEGGLSEPVAVTVSEGHAIRVTLPATVPDGVESIRLWRSEPDGTTLYQAKDVFAGVLEARLTQSDGLGREAQTLHLQPLPPGQFVRQLNGIAWMADGSNVVHGTALYPFLHHPAHHRFPYRDRIDMLQPVGEGEGGGFFIAAGKRVFWLVGSRTSKMSQRIVRPHGAVPGTAINVPGTAFGVDAAQVAYWMGTDGVPCIGLPGGDVQALTENRVAMHRFEQGASLLREANGLRSVVTAGRGGTTSQIGAGDSAEVVQYRNGIPVP